MLPDFLVIGAEKSGTTWLKHNLNSHPDIFIPSQKELHFFDNDENYRKGAMWYESFFTGVSQHNKKSEITPGYLANSKIVAKRIKDLLPSIKLIAILRDPVDRAWSNYLMNKADGNLLSSFDSCINKNHPIIKKGFYSSQLSDYLEHFEKSQILVLNFESLKSKPEKLLSDIYKFIGVDESYNSNKVKDVIFQSRKSRVPFLYNFISFTVKLLRFIGLNHFIDRNKKNVKNFLKEHNTKKSHKPEMKKEHIELLRSLYKEEVTQLQNEWGIKFRSWQ